MGPDGGIQPWPPPIAARMSSDPVFRAVRRKRRPRGPRLLAAQAAPGNPIRYGATSSSTSIRREWRDEGRDADPPAAAGRGDCPVDGGALRSRRHGELRLDITRGVAQPLPIAVSPFAGDRRTPQGRSPHQRTSSPPICNTPACSDLIDRRAFIQSAEQLRGAPRFADWRQINAQALVSGWSRRNPGGRLTVEFRLWDVFAEQQMRGLRVHDDAAEWRRGSPT